MTMGIEWMVLLDVHGRFTTRLEHLGHCCEFGGKAFDSIIANSKEAGCVAGNEKK